MPTRWLRLWYSFGRHSSGDVSSILFDPEMVNNVYFKRGIKRVESQEGRTLVKKIRSVPVNLWIHSRLHIDVIFQFQLLLNRIGDKIVRLEALSVTHRRFSQLPKDIQFHQSQRNESFRVYFTRVTCVSFFLSHFPFASLPYEGTKRIFRRN